MEQTRLNSNDLDLYRDLLMTVVKSRLEMDSASARADILLNIFLITVENPGPEAHFVQRVLNNLELDMLGASDAPVALRTATENTARTVWAYRKNPSNMADKDVRNALQQWESAYQQSMGEHPVIAYMDIENARCLEDAEYYSERPMPFVSRARTVTGKRN